MHPGLAWHACTMPPLPIAATAPVTFGHATVVPGGIVHPDGSDAVRNELNKKVSPELSERCTVMMGMSGNVTPGFSAAILASFHLVILPW